MRLIQYLTTFNPRWAIIVLTVTVMTVNLAQQRWQEAGVIRGEVAHHYAYLPSYFYGGNGWFSHFGEDVKSGLARPQIVNTPTLPNIGMAISYLPFFGLAHLAARTTGAEADGYSAPYQIGVMLSSLVYFVIGLIFLAKLLRLHFPGFVSTVTLIMICFGTNVFYYLTAGAGMPHAVSFMLCVLFIYQVISWHQMHDITSAVQLGLLLGALWLVQPVTILLGIVFPLYDVRRWAEVKARVRLFMRMPGHLLLMAGCCLLVMLAQFLFWNHATDDPLFNFFSGRGFHFSRPHVLQGLFSLHRGWLVHSPAMLLSLAGFFFLRGALRMYAWAIPVFFVTYIFFVFSWWCWWYGESFGQRIMIDVYPLLAIALGAFIFKLRRLGGIYKQAMFAALGALLLVNILLTWRMIRMAPAGNVAVTLNCGKPARPGAAAI